MNLRQLGTIGMYILIVLSIISCRISKDLAGKSYKYRSKKRTLQLLFDNDSICRLKNTFHCDDIYPEIKEITSICKYRRVGNIIYLRNLNCEDDDCKYDLTFNLSVQNSKSCYYLNEMGRTRKLVIGPSLSSEYEKFGLVPQIDIDTLQIIKNRIFLYKKSGNYSIGFFLK